MLAYLYFKVTFLNNKEIDLQVNLSSMLSCLDSEQQNFTESTFLFMFISIAIILNVIFSSAYLLLCQTNNKQVVIENLNRNIFLLRLLHK